MINLWPRSICDSAGAAAGAGVSVLAGAWARLQDATTIATGISETTATRDKHKRMSLHSSVKRVKSSRNRTQAWPAEARSAQAAEIYTTSASALRATARSLAVKRAA
jgi:hypothetical protein